MDGRALSKHDLRLFYPQYNYKINLNRKLIIVETENSWKQE